MAREIPVTQARDELADLVNRAAYGHERIVLTRHGRPVAALVSHADLAALEEHERMRREAAQQDTRGEQRGQQIRLAGPGDVTELPQPAIVPEPLRIAAQQSPPQGPPSPQGPSAPPGPPAPQGSSSPPGPPPTL
jgi:prevent-host-death family protein